MQGEENLELVFRMYKPESEELSDYYQPIQMESNQTQEMIEKIFSDCESKAPHVDKQNITLVPRKMDADIKRIMKPKIDDLMDQARKALVSMKGK